MGILSFSRSNKRARFDNRDRPPSWLAPVLPDWLDSKTISTTSSSTPLRDSTSLENKTARLSRSFSQHIIERCASTVPTQSNERTVPGNHPIGTPRSQNTGRRPMSSHTRPMSAYATSTLPPGAAAPTLGRVLDYDMEDEHFFTRPSIYVGFDDYDRSQVRCMSMSLDAYIPGAQITAATNVSFFWLGLCLSLVWEQDVCAR